MKAQAFNYIVLFVVMMTIFQVPQRPLLLREMHVDALMQDVVTSCAPPQPASVPCPLWVVSHPRCVRQGHHC